MAQEVNSTDSGPGGPRRKFLGLPDRWRLPVAIAVGIAGMAAVALHVSRSLPGPRETPGVDWLGEADPDAEAPVPGVDPELPALRREATQIARRLLEDYPETAAAIDVAATLHRRLDRVERAVRCWQRCLELDPRSARVHFALGSIARRKGDLAAAAEHFRKAAEIDRESRQLPYELADILIDRGEWDRAQAVVEANLKSDPRFFPSLYQLGQIHLQRKDYAKARNVLEEAVRYGPDFAATYFAMATVCTRIGDTGQAQKYLAKFRVLRARDEKSHQDNLKAAQNEVPGMRRIVAEISTAAARVYLEHGQMQKAEGLLVRACQLRSGYAACGDLLAWLYEQQGRAIEALNVLKQASAESPESIAVQVNLGTLAARLGRFDDAEQAYQKAISLSPGQAQAYAMLADLYLRAGRKLPEAKRLAQKAVELQPGPDLYRLLSVACEKTGDAAGARAAVEKAAPQAAGKTP